MPLSDADKHRIDREILHAAQVQDGLVPPDSPPDFVVGPDGKPLRIPVYRGEELKDEPDFLDSQKPDLIDPFGGPDEPDPEFMDPEEMGVVDFDDEDDEET